MGWENRNGTSYYYRKMRVGKKVVSEYVGRGEAAELIATFGELDSERRIAERIIVETEREKCRKVNAALDLIDQQAQALLREVLTAAGYHVHKGQWRKRRT